MEQGITQYVLFKLQDRIFGVEIFKVQEVIRYRRITPLPDSTGFVMGVINLRGTIIPVFDLKGKLKIERNESFSSQAVIIVLEINGRLMGVLADEIVDVQELTPENIQEAKEIPTGIVREYIQGFAGTKDSLVILINPDIILSKEELELLDAT